MLHTKLLKSIIKYCKNKNYVFSAKNCIISIPEFNHTLDCSFCYGQFECTMRYLISENYIERVGNNFRLSYKSLHRKKLFFKKFFSFLFCSFITPIVVSVVTTLLTLWIKTL